MSTRGRDWDAAAYAKVSAPQQRWASEQFERLALRGDEVVLDAGCGTGNITAQLAGMVPSGRVYGVDAAPSMVEHAAAALRDRDNVTVLCQDLVELELPEPVDVVFSNATFHWILDHAALFAALHRALRPGGRLVAQCGGRGNVAQFFAAADSVAAEEPFEHYFTGWRNPRNFAGPQETADRLRAAGFEQIETWLEPRPVKPEDPRVFVRTVCLVRHLDPLPQELRDPFLDRVLKRAGEPLTLHYVRLNMTARRP
jgi:trans-aconitate 2-methyltransferase